MKPRSRIVVGLAALVLVAVLAAGTALWLSRSGPEGATAEKAAGKTTLWTCGMHPQVVQPEPGTCPICGMDLVPLEKPAGGGKAAAGSEPAMDMEMKAAAGGNGTRRAPGRSGPEGATGEKAAGKTTLWTCGMHPQVVQPEPGTCPICGMDLVPLEKPAGGGKAAAGSEPAMDMKAAAGGDGTVVEIEPGVIQAMNVQTAPVERTDLVRTIRTVGSLAWDERAVTTVTTRYAGFVERTRIRHEGQVVRRGEVLAEIYSPELVRTAEELLAAKRYAARMASAGAGAEERARKLVASARRRLELLEVPPAAVRALEEQGVVPRTLPVVAPRDGIVMDPMPGLAGMEVRPGMAIARLADLSRLVLVAEVYEDQAPWLAPGMEAEVTFPFLPGREFRARVRDLRPRVAERTRTLELVLPLGNPDGSLRPGMYAEVRLAAPVARDVVAVPGQAILRTGVRDVAIVALGNGRFAPRELRLGRSAGGLVEVLEGLSPGDRIVISSQFLIDSEANLQDAIRKLVAGHGGHGGGHAR